jgi:DNA-binding HxlR family transcriptional regulator
MVLLDLLSRRMSLRILWELRDRSLTFRALQEAAETNPSVLNVRLRELRQAHLIEHGVQGYGLTPHGHELLEVFLPLHVWADEWAQLFNRRSDAASKKRYARARSSLPRAAKGNLPAKPKGEGP